MRYNGKWPYRFRWVLTTVAWDDQEIYRYCDQPHSCREYTPESPEITDVNYPPADLGRPCGIALVDREHKAPRINWRIPPGCAPVYYRLKLANSDMFGRLQNVRTDAHVIGYAFGSRRLMIGVQDETGIVYGPFIDDARRAAAEQTECQ